MASNERMIILSESSLFDRAAANGTQVFVRVLLFLAKQEKTDFFFHVPRRGEKSLIDGD